MAGQRRTSESHASEDDGSLDVLLPTLPELPPLLIPMTTTPPPLGGVLGSPLPRGSAEGAARRCKGAASA